MEIDNLCGIEIVYNNINNKRKLGLFEMNILDDVKKELKDSRVAIALLKNELNKKDI